MKHLLISAAAAALMAGTALAADLPVYEPPPVVETAPVAYDWTGFYVGINGGYGWGDNEMDLEFTDPPAGPFFAPCLAVGCVADQLDYDSDGFLIGGHAGFNWQSGWVVFGLEADIDYSDMEGGGAITVTVPPFAPTTTAANTDYDFFGTVRGRLGAAFDRFLVYGTGGLAYADVENSASVTNTLAQDFAGSEDDVFFGWTAGGGVEFAVTDNVTLGGEALYFDLGDETVSLAPVAPFVPPAGAAVDANFENTGVIARGRLSVKFGSLFGG